ncbi:uncharacterized protein LOC143360844 [Halictus rubicundus]|uniref:uncharacterized protein LOC143360844 n=1 Tax=Halictus rubicundus TaxID=77578 RepID=UPI0040354CA8
MNDEIQYLEKYSVAPSPSRDYYGLKVIRNKVILYIWKISHGPHKTPLVRTSNFVDFERDKYLQEEIQRAFGKYLLRHVKNIAAKPSQTLLTLPKNVVARLVDYLTVNDVVNLTALSHVAKEIFDENFVWEILCKRHTSLTSRDDKLSTNWKQLFRLTQIQGLMKEQKVFVNETRSRQPAKQTSAAKPSAKLDSSLKVSAPASKSTSKCHSALNQTPKKPFPDPAPKKSIQNPVPKKPSSHNFPKSTHETQISPRSKVPPLRSLQTGDRKLAKTAQSNTKVSTKAVRNHETVKSPPNKLDTKSDKRQIKPRRSDAKVGSNGGGRPMEDRSNREKPKRPTHASSPAIEKCGPMQSAAARSKKTGRKIGQSKSTSSSTIELPVNDRCATRDDSFDFADLIEASLKNIRSPMSMFDCNPICIDRRSCAGDGKEEKKMPDRPRILRSANRKTLDRLSEKSEPLTAKSAASNVSACSAVSGSLKAKEKTKNNAKLKESEKKIEKQEDKSNYLERYGIYQESVQRINAEEHRMKNRKKLLDKMAVLRSLGSSDVERSEENGVGGVPNPYEFRKRIGNPGKR